MTDLMGEEAFLRDILLKDVLKWIADQNPEVDHLNTVLWNLDIYIDLTHGQNLPAALLQCKPTYNICRVLRL